MPLNPRPIVGARSYAQYRAEREKLHADWLQRKKERDEKLTRGEEVGPEEPDPTEEREVGCLGLLKFILYATLFVVLAGKFFTGSFLWEMELPSVSQFMPVRARVSPSLFPPLGLGWGCLRRAPALSRAVGPASRVLTAVSGVFSRVASGFSRRSSSRSSTGRTPTAPCTSL